MRKIVLVALALSACAPVDPTPGLPRGSCVSAWLTPLLGRKATPSLVAQAKRRANATVARVLRPGQIVTMEYRDGRLNVNVDGENRVRSFTCG